ncbi:transglycosylase domain-containing protein [Polluticaenibacter yanchengensis]|uniref:Transglycosylase domain-containing protein n=1 Tax=Polluticaenibacter yanchengensis TaxID=3014562 RepID=A0ABT4UHW4_9BACT|nr:transglycosylase domain-containing protein [Chitinophagaceae bacterium LY-5]
MTKAVKILWSVFWIGLLSIVLLFVGVNYGLLGTMPSLEELENPSAYVASEVYADDGSPMGKYFLENRSPVNLKDISPNVINALVATEDERFFLHNGIDGEALMRVVKGAVTFNKSGGGSTITQQLALAMFGDDRATNKVKRVTQKLREWVIAVKLERHFTKEEIINFYLNKVEFSDNVFGIRNASLTFFQKEPDRLSVEEAAVLVGMVNAPTRYNPRRNPKASMDRRNLVLSRMAKNNFISSAQADELKRKPIELNYRKIDISQGIAPYFREAAVKDEVNRLLKDLRNANGDKYNIYKDGLRIYTSINPIAQQYAEEAVAKGMAANQKIFNQYDFVKTGSVFNKRQKELTNFIKQTDRWRSQKQEEMSDEDNLATFNVKVPMKIFSWNAKREIDTVMTPLDSVKYMKTRLHTGFMAMEPQTGYIKAWVGGIDFKTFKLDHANLKMKRQVGSVIKPMLYCQAVEEIGFNPATPLPNVPQYFQGSGWVPANKKGANGGSPEMARAIALSLNGSAAYLMKQIGPTRFVEFLKKCQVQTDLKPFPSMALGSCDLSLFEMMWMYSMFPGRGFNVKPQIITRIEDRNGNLLVNVLPQIEEVISENTAYTMAKMMTGAAKYGTATRMKNYKIGAVEFACKTGTTNDNTDAWFMGYTPELLCGAWVGGDEPWIHFPSWASAGYGGSAALPIVGSFLQSVYNDSKLTYDNKAQFIKPEVEATDVFYDFNNNNSGFVSPEAEGENMNNGNESDYGDFSNQYESNDIEAKTPPKESDKASDYDEVKPAATTPKDNKEKDNKDKPKDKEPKKDSTKPNSNPANKPKAVMQAPVKPN